MRVLNKQESELGGYLRGGRHALILPGEGRGGRNSTRSRTPRLVLGRPPGWWQCGLRQGHQVSYDTAQGAPQPLDASLAFCVKRAAERVKEMAHGNDLKPSRSIVSARLRVIFLTVIYQRHENRCANLDKKSSVGKTGCSTLFLSWNIQGFTPTT